MEKILIIEDDADLLEGLKFSLASDGYEVEGAETMAEGWRKIKSSSYDLLVLDCNLPDGNGFDFCTRFREYSGLPVLMLTARDTEMDEVKALALGADDYMSKPFSLAVLKARIQKLLHRGRAGSKLISGGIVVDKELFKVWKNGEEISLSRNEYQLLTFLMENKNQVLSKEQILAQVWDSSGKFVDENTISVNIRRLRTKIEEDPAHPARIKNIHGMGYIWKE